MNGYGRRRCLWRGVSRAGKRDAREGCPRHGVEDNNNFYFVFVLFGFAGRKVLVGLHDTPGENMPGISGVVKIPFATSCP